MNLFEGYNTVGEILLDAMKSDEKIGLKVQYPILLLVDFLAEEKGLIKTTDSPEVLAVYLDPNYKHRDYVNRELEKYVQKRKDDENWICYKYYPREEN
jgi:hypothetical protein